MDKHSNMLLIQYVYHCYITVNQKCSAAWHRYYSLELQTTKDIHLISNGRGVLLVIYSWSVLKTPSSANNTDFKSLYRKKVLKIFLLMALEHLGFIFGPTLSYQN